MKELINANDKYKICLLYTSCWDNAPQESFFGHLKDEVDIKHCNTFDELHTLISDYIDSVSYTHLDVYKRQSPYSRYSNICRR